MSRLGQFVRLGCRAIAGEGGSYTYLEDGGVGFARAALALQWDSPDEDPHELELTIAPRFQDRSIAGAQVPGTMIPFRWGLSQSIGGVASDVGGAYAPLAPLTARGVRVQLAATTVSVEVGYLPYVAPIAGWVDIGVTLCPIFGGGSSLVHHTMQIALDNAWYVSGNRPAFFEMPQLSREWKVLYQGSTIDRALVSLSMLRPDLTVVDIVTLEQLLDWRVLGADTWGFKFVGFGPTDGVLTASFR